MIQDANNMYTNILPPEDKVYTDLIHNIAFSTLVFIQNFHN